MASKPHSGMPKSAGKVVKAPGHKSMSKPQSGGDEDYFAEPKKPPCGWQKPGVDIDEDDEEEFEELDDDLDDSDEDLDEDEVGGEDDDEDPDEDDEDDEDDEGGGVSSSKTAKKPSSVPADDFSRSHFAARAWGGGRGTFVPDWVKAVCLNGNEMLVLAQLAYWFGKDHKGKTRAQKRRPGSPYRWVAKSYRELGEETGLNARQARHAVETLAGRGMLEKQPGRFGTVVVCYIRLLPKGIGERYGEAASGGK